MYLKRFANEQPKKKKQKDPVYLCYALFPDGKLAYVDTKTICYEDYLYEMPGWALRTDINILEKELCQLEAAHDKLLNRIIQMLETGADFNSIMQNKRIRWSLFSFLATLFHRHPITLEHAAPALRECGHNTNGMSDEEWARELLRSHLDKSTNAYVNEYNMILHITTDNKPFITSAFPTMFAPAINEWHIHYIPISPKYMITLVPRKIILTDMTINSSPEFVDMVNALRTCIKNPTLVSQTKTPLEKIKRRYYPLTTS
jgi:hypothetical protein